MKQFFLLCLLMLGSSVYGMEGVGEERNTGSLYRRAKKQMQGFDLKNLVDLTPFAMVATCYYKDPQLTLTALSLTMIVIILKNSYVQRKIRQCIWRLSRVIPFAIDRDYSRLCVSEK